MRFPAELVVLEIRLDAELAVFETKFPVELTTLLAVLPVLPRTLVKVPPTAPKIDEGIDKILVSGFEFVLALDGPFELIEGPVKSFNGASTIPRSEPKEFPKGLSNDI